MALFHKLHIYDRINYFAHLDTTGAVTHAMINATTLLSSSTTRISAVSPTTQKTSNRASNTAPSIRQTTFQNILRTASSHSTTSASLQKTKTQSPLGREKNITVMMSSDEDKVSVEITPDVKIELPVGSHVIVIRGCVYRVEVMKKRGLSIVCVT